MEQFAKELVKLRGETSKTYDLGKGKKRLVTGGGIQHWKQDYSSKTEEWKECDLRWDGNRIEKAPYILEVDDKKLTFYDRKTKQTSTLELVSIKPAGLKFEIIPFNSGVHFQHKVPNLNVPFAAQFKVEGTVPHSRAYDDIGELELEVTYDKKTGILTERLTEVRSADSKELRQASGEIRIDPTLTVQPSSKDNWILKIASTNNFGTSEDLHAGRGTSADWIYRTLIEFDISALPGGVTLDTATMSLYYFDNASGSGRTINVHRLLRLDWHETQSTWNIYKTGSNWGTAGAAGSTDITSTDMVQVKVPSSYGWMNWNILKQVEWAYDEEKAVACRVADNSETTDSRWVSWRSKEYTTDTSLRPKLTIEYTEAADDHKRSAFFPFM